mgnify:CR=1 FL=1
MGTITKNHLSQSSNGGPIAISATSSPGTIIHTTSITASIIDEIWLYATNNDNVTRSLTVEIGGISSMTLGISAKTGLSIILPGTIISGNGSTSSTVSAYSSNTNVVNVLGYINRIEQ